MQRTAVYGEGHNKGAVGNPLGGTHTTVACLGDPLGGRSESSPERPPIASDWAATGSESEVQARHRQVYAGTPPPTFRMELAGGALAGSAGNEALGRGREGCGRGGIPECCCPQDTLPTAPGPLPNLVRGLAHIGLTLWIRCHKRMISVGRVQRLLFSVICSENKRKEKEKEKERRKGNMRRNESKRNEFEHQLAWPFKQGIVF